jgi:hypothetical protein
MFAHNTFVDAPGQVPDLSRLDLRTMRDVADWLRHRIELCSVGTFVDSTPFLLSLDGTLGLEGGRSGIETILESVARGRNMST